MKTQTVEVHLYGEPLGVLAQGEETNRDISFQYFPEFISKNWNPSPIHLPVSNNIYQFPNLKRLAAFNGLPGVFADSLPDKFGLLVINKYYAEKGIEARQLTELQKLTYVGSRGMGALEYFPSEKIPSADIEEAAKIRDLRESVQKVISGKAVEKVPLLYKFGGSAGGARSKAIIAFNPGTQSIEIGTKFLKPNYKHCLLKFDGVHPTDPSELDSSLPWTKTEYVYSQMARQFGLNIPETYLLEENGRYHFLIDRFDRTENQKIHMHSLGGLTHSDFNVQRDLSYEIFFRTINQIVGDHRDIIEAYKRMVFNVVSCNRDDHVKNFSFLMDLDGLWRLSPAYDTTFAYNPIWCKEHQMTINGKSTEISREDLLNVAKTFKVKNAATYIDECLECISQWPRLAKAIEIEKSHIKDLKKHFRSHL